MKKLFLIAALLLTFKQLIIAQNAPFNIHLEPMTIDGLGGLQSYSFGQSNGKWLVLGGRLDGLHRRQPFAAFDVAGNNNQIIVVDPVQKQKWSMPLSSLPQNIQEQLSSTNMQFHQDGNYLYITGGYGYNVASGTRKTFNSLIAVDVPAVINAVINNTSITSYFRQIIDDQFAVTGGHLEMINNTFYLIGGHRFDGNYNPMGNPTFTQTYTNAIRKFKIIDDGQTITINHLTGHYDAANLRRRDYNAVAQILPDGSEGITAFSGVFQQNADLPFLNCVNIDSQSYVVNNAFQQFYNHYHCAVLPLYSAKSNEMHTLFFGGIAQYYENNGILIQDNNVPFVKTIARVTRDANGTMSEYKLPIEMPSLLGAGSEFIVNLSLDLYNNHVVKLDALTTDTTHVGYIFGGISSTAANIFFSNTGAESIASNQIFKVYIVKNNSVGVHNLNTQSVGSLQMNVFPNPNDGEFTIKFNLKETVETKISIYRIDGKKIEEKIFTDFKKGENIYHKKFRDLEYGRHYIVTIETPYEKSTQKIIVE